MSTIVQAKLSAGATSAPQVVFIGGPDVDARLELMGRLSERFNLSALGTQPALHERFATAGFAYQSYRLSARTNPLTDLRGLGELVALLRQLRPQIVHTFATRPSVWGRLAARLAGVPIVIGTLPGLGSLYASESRQVQALRAIYKPLQRLACQVSDRTIFQNDDDLRQFIAEDMVPADRALVIPGSGVPTERFDPARVSAAQRAALRTELGLPQDAVVVTMISRVIRSKGVLEFVAAAQQLATSHPNVRFLLVGPRADDSVDRLNESELTVLNKVVSWPGARRDILTVLAASDMFTLPSAYREGIPRVLLEAASMELPLITSDAPGCREVAVHEQNGLLIPPGDATALAAAIARLADEPEVRRRLGLMSRQRATERFDLAVVANQTSKLYGELLMQRGFGSTATA